MRKICFVFIMLVCFSLQINAETFRVGLYPYDSPSKLYKNFKTLLDYMEKHSGYKFEMVMARNYITHIRNVGEGRVDIAIMGPLPYVRVKDKFRNIEAIAKLSFYDDRMNNILFIANSKYNISNLADLKGKSFAFGDYNSCGSHYFPRYVLLKSGIKLSDFKFYDFLGSHSKVVLAVANGDFDAGGVRSDIFYNYPNRNLKIIGGPFKIDPHVIVINNKIDKHIVDKLKNILFNINDPNVLSNIENNFKGFEIVKNEEFNTIRKIIKIIDEEY